MTQNIKWPVTGNKSNSPILREKWHRLPSEETLEQEQESNLQERANTQVSYSTGTSIWLCRAVENLTTASLCIGLMMTSKLLNKVPLSQSIHYWQTKQTRYKLIQTSFQSHSKTNNFLWFSLNNRVQKKPTVIRLYYPLQIAPFVNWQPINRTKPPRETEGAGIAQWLERRTRDWKVAGSNPCWNGGRIFFSRVDFLCWLFISVSVPPPCYRSST